MERERGIIKENISKRKIVFFGIVPFAILSIMIVLILSYPNLFFSNPIKPLPEISIEKVEFQPSKIITTVRNTGHSEVSIVQADVNDRIHSAAMEPDNKLERFESAKVIIPFTWNEGEPYGIGLTTDDGTRFEKTVQFATLTPQPTLKQASNFALIGTYVGVIPVMIGLLWYPFIRKLSLNKYNFFLSFTVGLLVFLGIDALLEGNEIVVRDISSAFHGQMLLIMVAILSLVSLIFITSKLVKNARAKSSESEYPMYTEVSKDDISNISSVHSSKQNPIIRPVALSMMIAVGIGLHNFGEGLAIGAAVLLGEVALSSFLILGFTLHNTTEGLAIVAPMARSKKLAIAKLILMGLIAGVPTIVGSWIGGFLYSPVATIIFLGIGAGAIFQVVYSVGSWMYYNNNKALASFPIVSGFMLGIFIMYITGCWYDKRIKIHVAIWREKYSSKMKNESNVPNSRLEFIRDANVTKKEERTDRMEDYLEVIYELIRQKGYATTVDISNYLNVSSPSVTKMIQKLDESGYLDYEKYRGIRLTDDGIKIAKSIHNRHEILAQFFRMMGVDEEIANNDAEGIEHHLHHETFKKLEEFMTVMKSKWYPNKD